MSSAFRYQLVLTIVTVLGVVAMGPPQRAAGQAGEHVAIAPIYTFPSPTISAHPIPLDSRSAVLATRPRGPLARLVRNSDNTDGLPPFALTDQSGAIQRYVEPLPSIDLESYVGSIVTVRHDTGTTLLASQLELPPLSGGQVGGPTRGDNEVLRSVPLKSPADIRRAAFVDNDDTTVELLGDGGANSNEGDKPVAASPRNAASNGTIEPIAENGPIHEMPAPQSAGPIWSEELPSGGGPVFADSFPPEMADGGMDYPVDEYGVPLEQRQPYYEDGMSFDDFGGSRGLIERTFNSPNCRLFGDVELMLMRLHLTESVAGKLSEQYKFSPRVIIGFEGGDISDGRVRYWTYDHHTPILEGGGGSVRFEFEVLDIEATQRFQIRRSDIIVGAGLRLAKIVIEDDFGDEVGTDLQGLTVAADARTHLCNFEDGAFSWVYGARLSILGGDWGGDPGNDLVAVPAQDDNVVANELHAGVEYSFRVHSVDLQARLAFEMQNWHSDVFARSSQADTIGFIGPGIHLGAQF